MQRSPYEEPSSSAQDSGVPEETEGKGEKEAIK